MYPELIRFEPFVISSYGVMLATAFLVGMYVTTRLVRQRGVDEDAIINLAFIIIMSAIVGSRLLYVIMHPEEFQGRWLYAVLPVQPDGTIGLSGLIFLGGFIAAVIASVFYVRKKKLPVWKTADSIAPAVALGLFFGRIGCFLNGCCFGKSCELFWGMQFPAESPAGAFMGDAHLHPTQLYSAGYALALFLLLMWLNRRGVADGIMSGVFLCGYGIARFSVDFFRFYESQMQVGPLYLNQVISIVMVIAGVAIILRRSKIEPAIRSINS